MLLPFMVSSHSTQKTKELKDEKLKSYLKLALVTYLQIHS
jgi:hypothetical protein